MLYDAMSNIQAFVNTFNQLVSDPAKFVINKYGIPKEIANNPDAIIQKLMSEGKISQGQYNMARKTAIQMQNNPLFKQLMGIK